MTFERVAAGGFACLVWLGRVSASAMPAAFANEDVLVSLRECGESPVRTISCIGAQRSGKSTLLRSMFGAESSSPDRGVALLEARSNLAYLPDTNEFEMGTGQTIVSFAVSDVIIYNVLVHDLSRSDALSDLQPAIEELLALHEDGIVDAEQQKSVTVAVRDCEEGVEDEVVKKVTGILKAVWAATIKPEAYADSALEDVLDVNVACLPHHSFASDRYMVEVDRLKKNIMKGEPETPATEVARLLEQVSSYAGPSTEAVSSAALKAAFVCSGAATKCFSSFEALMSRMAPSFTELNKDFGELADGIIETVLDEYDEATKAAVGSSWLVSKKKEQLKRAVMRELGQKHAQQMIFLAKASREKFDQALAGMRVSPDVGKAMSSAIQDADKFFTKTASGMNSRHGSWPSSRVRRQVKDEMRQFATERLQLVQAQGGFINMKKRKPVGMAFHWFLPKPFGTEAQRSVLSQDDPMRFTHHPDDASPMFLELVQPKDEEFRIPQSDKMTEVEPTEEIKFLKETAQKLVHNREARDARKKQQQ